jgi:hypothetical protein
MSSTAVAAREQYPKWKFYPSWCEPPAWAKEAVAVFSDARSEIDSRRSPGLSSDATLAVLRPALVQLGFKVEASKSRADKLSRPVLYGEAGESVVAYEVDGFHPGHGIVLEGRPGEAR